MYQSRVRVLIQAIVILVVLGIPAWDKLAPAAGFEEIIRKEYGSQLRWCVAFTYSWNSTTMHRERIYVLFPGVFSDGSLVSVSSSDDNSPSAWQIDYGAFFTLFVYGSMAFGWFKTMQLRKDQGGSHAGDSG